MSDVKSHITFLTLITEILCMLTPLCWKAHDISITLEWYIMNLDSLVVLEIKIYIGTSVSSWSNIYVTGAEGNMASYEGMPTVLVRKQVQSI